MGRKHLDGRLADHDRTETWHVNEAKDPNVLRGPHLPPNAHMSRSEAPKAIYQIAISVCDGRSSARLHTQASTSAVSNLPSLLETKDVDLLKRERT
jgi:hypothetical protein